MITAKTGSKRRPRRWTIWWVLAIKNLILGAVAEKLQKTVAKDFSLCYNSVTKKAIYSIVKEILLVCDRIDQQETVDDMTSSIEDELLEILERREFYRMPPSDEFDPLCHNAVGTVEETPDHPEKTVVRVVRSGYYFRDRVFRPADVIVAVKRNDMDYAD